MKIGLIGGTGLGEALGAGEGTRHEIETPFGPTSEAIVETQIEGVTVFTLARHGRGHLINPSELPARANLFAMKKLGVTHILASGAVGSLREEFKPTHLVIPDQVIDRTYRRANTFYDKAAVHVEMAEPFCPVMRQIIADASTDSETKVHSGACYVCMEGPAFSTKAESHMHRILGGDLIGMTAMPEARLAREAEISYALIAMVTDYDCWKAVPVTNPPKEPQALLDEIIGHLKSATHHCLALMRKSILEMAKREEELMRAPAQNALKLAIWSDRQRIPETEVSRLLPLWQRYFDAT